MKIIQKPTSRQLEELQNWLYEESLDSDEGFYNNIEIIRKSFLSNMLIIGEENDQIVGFIVFTDSDKYVELDILNIKASEQGKGYGKKLYQQFEKITRQRKKITIKLFCSPEESEAFWKKMGYTKLIDTGLWQHELSYYKPLIQSLKPLDNSELYSGGYQIKLWDCEPDDLKYSQIQWVWSIKKSHNFTEEPIFAPCNKDWLLQIIDNGEVVKSKKVKYITSEYEEFFTSKFLYINENPIK